MKKTLSLLLVLALTLALALPVSAAEYPLATLNVPEDVMLLIAPAPTSAPDSQAVVALSTTAAAEKIQKYGNVTLELTCEEILAAGFQFGDVLSVSFLGETLELPFCNNYSDVDSGTAGVFARTGDTNVLVAINMGDFATTYGIATKETFADKTFQWNYVEGVEGPVAFTLALKTAGGYYDEYVMHQLSYTNERADYPELSDAQFANFRAVATTGMGANKLYRTASPVNPENNRNTYADAALREAGVTVVMNLADDAATVASYEGYADSYYATTQYIALNMGVDFSSAEFQSKLAEGLRFFAENKGVYAVHCTEGKDRAGFVVALLECLMGATYDEVVADYMVTFYNYYGVTPDEARYSVIAKSNIVKTLQNAFGGASLAAVDLSAIDLSALDLAPFAEAYIAKLGLTADEIAALKENLAGDVEKIDGDVDKQPTDVGPIEEQPVEVEPAVVEPVEVEPVADAVADAAETVYVVVKGDCLWNIAKKFYGAGKLYTKLVEANGIKNPDFIAIGQTLVIPAL